MRVAYLQFAPIFGAKKENLERVEHFLDGAKVDLVVLPELFATGYLFESRTELMDLAEDDRGETLTSLKGLSLKFNMAIVAGVAEKADVGCYNSCYLLDNGEIRSKYRKIHLFDREKELFVPGDLPLEVIDVRGVRVGLMICFDWIFPEVTRILAVKGAQIVCHPSNLVLPYCPRAMITRCIENSIFAITVNRVGTEARAGIELRFIGLSQVVGPRGEILVRAGETEEVLRVIDIDPSLADNKMITERNHVLNDRRPEFYGDLVESTLSQRGPHTDDTGVASSHPE